ATRDQRALPLAVGGFVGIGARSIFFNVIVRVPQNALLRSRTGMCAASSLYQIKMFAFPVAPSGCTRTVLNVPASVLMGSRPSTCNRTSIVFAPSFIGKT